MPKKPTKKEIDAFIKENSVFPEGAIPPEYFDVLAYCPAPTNWTSLRVSIVS